MAKTRLEKEQSVKKLEEQFSASRGTVFVDYKGLNVPEIEGLRHALRQKNIELAVVKNSLVRMVLRRKGVETSEDIFTRPLAVAFGREDEVEPAKEIGAFAKKHEALEILAGILGTKMIDAKTVKKLAALPSKEELYGRLVGSIASPLSGLMNVLAGNMRGLINVLKARRESIN